MTTSSLMKRQSIVLLVAALLAAPFFTSCEKEENADTSARLTPFSENFFPGDVPARHITQSEKLEIPASVDLPSNDAGNSRVATYYAVGVQKYRSQAKANTSPVIYEWVFVAPLADLYDITNKNVGLHGAGPFWTTTVADSIFAQHFSPVRSAPAADPSSVDWLLLMPKNGTTPTGIFQDVDYIQRIATVGGKAPVTPPTAANQTVDVNYTAIYRLSKKN